MVLSDEFADYAPGAWALRKARQASRETVSFVPSGALESRTATSPGRLRATSTQLPLWLL